MNPWLEQAKATASFLSEALPVNYEIYVFDLTKKKVPVAASFRTKSRHTEALRKYVRAILENETVVANGMLTRRGDAIMEKRLYRTSVQLFKDENGKPVSALVLCMDIMDLLSANETLNSLLSFDTTELEEINPKTADDTPIELTLEVIDRETADFTDAPERLTPDERSELLMDLYDTGVFELKGSVAHAAFVLKMSEQSIYRYLTKIRQLRGE